jgi:DNA-binding transcriptional LysR family regulator
MNLLIPQLVRGEVDVVVGRSAAEHTDPQIEAEVLYMEPIHFVCRPRHPLVRRRAPGWNDLLAYQWIVWPRGTPVRAAFETALAAAGQAMPPRCVESNSSLLNITLLNHTDMLGVASHRGALRFERMTALKVLPVQLAGFGTVSMYWRPDSLSRAAVAAALDCLRTSAAAGADSVDALDDPPTSSRRHPASRA